MYRHPAPASRSVSLLGATLVASLVGCTSWEELPADATGFLVVDRATLTGTVNGEQVVPGSTRASGYCISGGWRLELRASTEAGEEVTHVVEVLDLDATQQAEKRALIDDYPEIADDVASLAASAGTAALVRETLHRPLPLAVLIPSGRAPLYEAWGEDRVRAGIYAEALRWSHLEPIVARLARRLDAAT